MKYFFLFALLFLVSCDTSVETKEEEKLFLWKLWEDDPDYPEEEIFGGPGGIISDDEYFYFHNTHNSATGRVYKISLDGKVAGCSDIIGMKGFSPLLISGDKLYSSVLREGIYCLDKNTLNVIWKIPGFNDPGNLIAVDEKKLYESTGYSVIAYDKITGEKIWETGSRVGIARGRMGIDEDRIYLADFGWHKDGHLYFIDKETGKVERKITVPYLEEYNAQFGGAYRGGTLVYNDKVIVGAQNWHIYAFNKHTGDKEWEFIADAPVSVPLTISNGILFTGTLNSTVFAIDPETGIQRWKYHEFGSFFVTRSNTKI